MHRNASMPSEPWTDADFVAGHPALDFVNTVGDIGRTRSVERLVDLDAARTWLLASGLVNVEARVALERSVPGRPEHLRALRSLREDAYELLTALVESREPDPASRDAVERCVRSAIGRAALVRDATGFHWRVDVASSARWTDALALSLEALLRDPVLSRLRRCGRCTWLFLDNGRGTGRRWCDMRTCGNRAKAEAFRGR